MRSGYRDSRDYIQIGKVVRPKDPKLENGYIMFREYDFYRNIIFRDGAYKTGIDLLYHDSINLALVDYDEQKKMYYISLQQLKKTYYFLKSKVLPKELIVDYIYLKDFLLKLNYRERVNLGIVLKIKKAILQGNISLEAKQMISEYCYKNFEPLSEEGRIIKPRKRSLFEYK